MKYDYIKIHERDSCAVVINENADIPFGHKIALEDIRQNSPVIKYGFPIGTAIADIKKGEHIHTHNLKTALSESGEYEYKPDFTKNGSSSEELYFYGYERSGSRVGIRNEIWIIPTVGCANSVCALIAKRANEEIGEIGDGVFAFSHPYGCSQLGEDLENTKKILAGIAKNGNAGAVLLVSLGCENNNLSHIMPEFDGFDKSRLRTMVCQEEDDEIEAGVLKVRELARLMKHDKRKKLPLSRLTVGLKCGGSDGLSGITANALCGRFTDILTKNSGRAVLTEVPEMFGAENLLLGRAQNREVFEKAVGMINGFKKYFTSHSQPVSENPSPGNRAGGITTLEEKSLGCVQKGGSAVITDVLDMGEICKKDGLSLLCGPGNDMVSCTLLTAAGANIILFTTGRGTPYSAPVPTVKISSNTALYLKKKNWIDYNSGDLLKTKDYEAQAHKLADFVISVASGEAKTKSEKTGVKEIAIFKDGITL